MKVTYQFSGFKLACDTITGDAFTYYNNGPASRRPLVPDDSIHAAALGITPQQHAIAHELAHHLLSGDPDKGCDIIFADAYGYDMPYNAELLEWHVTAITYLSYRKPMPEVQDWGAIMDMQKAGIDFYGIAEKLRRLMKLIPVDGVEIVQEVEDVHRDALYDPHEEYDQHDNHLPKNLKGGSHA